MTLQPLERTQAVARADLHMHSSASDGLLSPEALMNRASACGVGIVALTDHDTLGGLAEAQQAAKQLGIQFIPGVELSADGGKQVHLLGYGVSAAMSGIVQLIAQMRADRTRRMHLFLQKVEDLGLSVQEADLVMEPGTAFSRPVLARAMVSKGYVESVEEAFDLYLASGRPAYVPRMHIGAEQVIDTMRRDGAVPVLAHPGARWYDRDDMLRRFPSWVRAGLRGVEVCHPVHSAAQRLQWQQLAHDHGLFATAGSDFHGTVDALHGEIGSQFAHWQEHEKHLRTLMSCMM